MTIPSQDNQTQENKVDTKEMNFRALQAKYERQLAEERQARMEAEKEAQAAKRQAVLDEDDGNEEPYVDNKRLTKTLQKFGQQNKQETQSEIQKAVQTAIYEERKGNWIKNNKDFYDVLQHADKLVVKDPELAETILEMPDNFERQKLVYKNIKALGLHEPEKKPPSIQEKVDANRRSPFYQPSGVGTAPYSSQGDFSPTGQKQAYDKLQELKSRLRI